MGSRDESGIHAPPGFRGSRGKLERSHKAHGTSEPEDQLLDQEMSGVCRAGIEVTSQRHGERDPERDRHPLEELKVETTLPALETAHDEASHAGAGRELLLGPAAALARPADLHPEPVALLTGTALRIPREPGSPDAWHDRHMIFRGASPALMWAIVVGAPAHVPDRRVRDQRVSMDRVKARVAQLRRAIRRPLPPD